MLATPQGTILNPILFIVFIKDLDGEALWGVSTLSKSTDCPKLGRVADPQESCAAMQGDLQHPRETGWKEPHEVQPEEQIPAPGQEQPSCWAQPTWKAAWLKRTWDVLVETKENISIDPCCKTGIIRQS